MQLSTISSPTFAKSAMYESLAPIKDFKVMSQLAASRPEEGNVMGPNVRAVPDTAIPTYQTVTPVQLPAYSDLNLTITMLSADAASCVCRVTSAGQVNCYCRPLLDRLDDQAYAAKLYVKALAPGEGRIVVEVSTMNPLAHIIIDVNVLDGNGLSVINDASIRPGQSLYIPETSMRIDARRPGGPDFVPRYVSMTGESPLARSRLGQSLTGTQNSKAAEIEDDSQARSGRSGRNKGPRADISIYGGKPKYIRVLPSDLLMGPAIANRPNTKKIRVRNTYQCDLNVECFIAPRSFVISGKNIFDQLSSKHASFGIIGPKSFVVKDTGSADSNYIEVVVQFAPESSPYCLHVAKLVLNVKPLQRPFGAANTDRTSERAFQVPLLGVSGMPYIVPFGYDLTRSLHMSSFTDETELCLRNDGSAAAFLKVSCATVNKYRNERGQGQPSGDNSRYVITPSACVIQPGCSKNFRISELHHPDGYRRRVDEQDVIEIRYGHEALRLLGMAVELTGPWAGLVETVQLRDDPLRVMGSTIETIRIVINE